MKTNTVKGLAIALMLSVSAVTGLSGCAGDRYHQSTGEYIDDKSTSSRVRDSLSNDPEYKYREVQVTAFKGTVQLSGFVDHRPQKERAGMLAKNTAGVKDVVNNITVKD
jgi:hyperosmotically inducible protein